VSNTFCFLTPHYLHYETTDTIPSRKDWICDSICFGCYHSSFSGKRPLFHITSRQPHRVVGGVPDNWWHWYWAGTEPGKRTLFLRSCYPRTATGTLLRLEASTLF
jgi:hypothetical protein